MSAQKHYSLLHTIDICDAIFYAQLSEPSKIPEWILNGDFANIKLLFPSISMLQIVYGRVLLEKREYAKLIGLSDSFLETAGIFPNVLSQVYTLIYLAAVYEKLGHYDKSAEALKKRSILRCLTGCTFRLLKTDSMSTPCCRNLAGFPAMLHMLNLRNTAVDFRKPTPRPFNQSGEGISKRRSPIDGTRTGSGEIGGKGFSNREIGEYLFITENTVKARLKHIFEKLSLRSRVQLKDAIDKM